LKDALCVFFFCLDWCGLVWIGVDWFGLVLFLFRSFVRSLFHSLTTSGNLGGVFASLVGDVELLARNFHLVFASHILTCACLS
jgi:hypothetical protein